MELAGPVMAELDALAVIIRRDAKEYFEESSKLFEAIAKKLETAFADVAFPSFELADSKTANTKFKS
jgi:hypothetical protein